MALYGVGTGRCGTKSLAAYMRGVHEPTPWLREEAIAAYWGDPVARALCIGKLRSRLRLYAPIVVDMKQSYLIPLICRLDPEAAFVWMVRNPAACIASFLAGGSWTETNQYGAGLWHPRAGWALNLSRFDKAMIFWREVNHLIAQDLAACGRPWQCVRTEELGELRHNRHPASPKWRFTPEEAGRIVEACGVQWDMLRSLQGPAQLLKPPCST